MCVATNWVTVSDCFVVGCRDDVHCYKLGHCWQLLCRGLQKMGIPTNWDIVNNWWVAEVTMHIATLSATASWRVAEMRMCTAMNCLQ